MPDNNDIAIIGMALRVPGASTPEQFWDNLRTGFESLQTYSEEHLRAHGVPAAQLADPHYVPAGMPLQDFDQFDPEFFGFSPKEAAILDPQHRQFYEVAWEALERAGCVPESTEGAIGVFAGCGMGAYFSQNILRNADLMRSVGLFLLRHTGNDKDFLATRVSYAFDLKGPSINVQTACSTSLVATHLAVQSLLARETDVALAGGVTIEIPHGVGYVYHDGEILSPDGHCRSFDHRSKGTVFGSGVAVIVLKRIEDALRDGDHIHAVIKGSAVNNDGASKVGYLAPSVEGQAAAITEAIALAGLEAGEIGYVECHGTGTQMGDPIEVAALTQAFRESSSGVGTCLIGSVKSNIGHLDTAAGVAGLIKAVLALEHEAIPPSLNFEAPNPAIAFDGSPFRVAAELTPWPRSQQPRRAAVNSLGVGGTNAFVVLEEAPGRHAVAAPPQARPQVLTLSARSRKALDDYAQRLATWLRAHPDVDLAQVAVSLVRGRRAFDQRRVLAVRDTAEAIELLERPDPRRVFNLTQEVDKPSVVFMFPGGGAQYPGMGRALYHSEPAFRAAMDRGLDLLKNRFGVDLRPVFATDPPGSPELDAALNRPSIQLPLVFLIEISLVALWRSYGVNPEALIGHSMGENAAACAAGVFSLEDGLGLVLLRGRLMDDVPDGGMLSVPMAAAELREVLGPDLDLAAANGPTLSIASGAREPLDALAARLAARGVESRRVRINIAAHSRMLDGILEPFRKYLRSIRLNAPNLPIVSNHTGQWLTAAEATDPEYWVRHLRNTVLFSDSVQLLLQQKDRVFLEVGPGSILSSFVRQSHDAPVQRVLGSLRHPEDPAPDDVYFRTVLGRLASMGVPIDREQVWPANVPRRPLPTYAFQHSRYWIEPTAQDLVAQDDQDLVPERLAKMDDWLSGPRWVQRGIFEVAEREQLTWCVFHDREPLASRCIDSLRAEGHRVVEVVAGDAFSRIDDEHYTLAPEGGAGVYLQLVEALVAADRLPDRILHTWLLTRREVFRPGKTFLHRNQEFGFYSLFYLARAFAKRGAAKRSHWIVVGNGGVSLAGEMARYPDKATVLGACAVIPRELPSITCNYVDLQLPVPRSDVRKAASAPSEDDARIGQSLLEELHASPANGVTAWRDRVRWVRYLAPHRSKSSGKSVPIRTQGVYLITGGFGGVAGIVAEWLAREHRARLVLMSRTPLPPRPDWDAWIAEHDAHESISMAIGRIRELEDLGAEVLPIAADVAVSEQVEEAVQVIVERFGTLHGVFHAAGVLRDGLIALKSEREIEEVFAAKLYGSLVLDRACRALPMDFMVLFSSVSAYVAPVGQIDYVAANAFLNAFAEFCHGSRPYPVVAINWGIWKDVGMVASPHSTQAETDPARAELASSRELPVSYPLFRMRHVSNQETVQVHWISGEIPAGHWIADEHRLLRGDALVPATGYVEFIRAALVELGEPSTGWKLASLTLLQPFYVEDGRPRSFRISLRGNPGRWRVQVFVDFSADTEENWQLTATARVLPAPVTVPESLDLAAIEARCAGRAESSVGDVSLRTRQEAHLRFGSRWHVLRRLQLGTGEALAWLKLSESLAPELADFAIHPGLLDIATGCAMDLIPGYAELEVPPYLWVPVGYGSFVSFGPMPSEFQSWVRISPESSLASGSAAFDIVLADAAGRPFAIVERLSIRQLKDELPRQPARPTAGQSQAKSVTQSPAERALAHNRERGIRDAEGVEVLRRVLGCIDRPVIIASSFRPQDLVRQADAVSLIAQSPDSTRFARPEMETSFEAPRDEIERSLAELWGGLLGVEGIGIRDSFFDLGGHSLVAVRLFNEIADKYGVDLPMSVLMQHPDVASLAERIRGGPVGARNEQQPAGAAAAESVEEPYRHVVPMQAGSVGAGTPLFIVSGMFGNVLNLSHMAHLLGEDRPFLALQARGLYGEAPPHETFEEMARDYLVEVRRVQPVGPYLLGGFSGGGLVAFEMARQLMDAGERVDAMILLDTPIREPENFGVLDRIEMWLPGLKAEGPAFLARKLRERRAWRRELQAREQARATEAASSLQFHSQRVGDAFLRALARYKVPRLEIPAILLRPKLKVKFRLRDGRLIDTDRNVLKPDNGWSPYVSELRVIEVPGNHDSMVLEPNVRVLTSALRKVLARAV